MYAKIKEYYFLFLILIFASFILSINLDKLFIGHHDWNGAWYSNFARNFTRYGLLETKFGSTMNYDLVTTDNFRYFTHYPPLLPIFIYISFLFFGIHEWSARLIPLIFTLATVALIYQMGIKFFDKKVAALASIFSIVFPITIYFGKMPVQEVVVIAPVLLAIIFYFDFFKKQSKNNFLKLILALVFAHLINWPGYYITPLFFAHYLIFSNSKNRLQTALIFPLLSIVMFSTHLLHTFILTGKLLGGGITEVLLYRLNLADSPADYSTVNFIKQQVRTLTIYFTRPILLLSSLFLILLIPKLSLKKIPQSYQLLIILLIFGITHNLIFRNMAFIHDYMIIYLLPCIALSASFAFFEAVRFFNIKNVYIYFTIAALFIVSAVAERINFTSALLSSSGFKEGVELGKIINLQTKSGEKILVLSPDFKRYYEVFTDYYADRNISYHLPSPQRLQSDLESSTYSLIIAIPSRDTPQSLITLLQEHYKEAKIDQFVIFDTQSDKNTIKTSLFGHSGL